MNLETEQGGRGGKRKRQALRARGRLKRQPGSAGRLRRDGGRPLRRDITGAKLLKNGLENVTFTGQQLETAS